MSMSIFHVYVHVLNVARLEEHDKITLTVNKLNRIMNTDMDVDMHTDMDMDKNIDTDTDMGVKNGHEQHRHGSFRVLDHVRVVRVHLHVYLYSHVSE
jgi:hypothetical protein